MPAELPRELLVVSGEPLVPSVDVEPEPVELVVPPVPDEMLDPWVVVVPGPVELAFDPLAVAEELLEPEFDVDPVFDELPFAVAPVLMDVVEFEVEFDPELEEPLFDPLPEVDVEFELLPLECDPEPLIASTACHQFSTAELTALELVDVEDAPVPVGDVGFVFAAVFEALCVLAVPPLTFGWTLIDG